MLFTTGCTQIKWKHHDKTHTDYRYYVIDINGTEPDASFEDQNDAQKYVDIFKEFHEYRIVKTQSYTNTKEQ